MMYKSYIRNAALALLLIYIPALFAIRFPGNVTIQQEDNLSPQLRKKITFIIYMAADNSLAEFANSDILESASIGSNGNINVLVYLSTKQPNQPKVTKKLFVQKGYCIQDGDSTAKDSGDVNTVIDALTWAITKFPSDQLVVGFWNHGSGSLNRGFDPSKPSFWWMPNNSRNHCMVNFEPLNEGDRNVCYDDSTGNSLNDASLIQALDAATKLRGKKIDIVFFDACLMADVEVAYTLAPYTNYVVASQETIPGDGYGYGKVLAYAADGTIDARAFAKGMVDAYQAEYNGVTDDYTLSAVDTSKVDQLVTQVNAIAQTLQQLLKTNDARMVRYIIKTSRAHSAHFTEEYYIDWLGFCNNMTKQLSTIRLHNAALQKQLLTQIQAATAALNQAVFEQARGKLFANVGGLSIYFDPRGIDETYPTLYWSQHTSWLNFLEAYLQ